MLSVLARIIRTLPKVIIGFYKHDGPFLAAGISWYALLSVFPLLLISIAVFSHVVPSSQPAQDYTMQIAAIYLPPNIVKYLGETVRNLNHDSGKAGVFGLIALLWSGRHLFRALELSIHRAWRIPIRRSFLRGNFLAMSLIILCGGMTCAVAVANAVLTWFETILSHVQLPALAGLSLDQALFWKWFHSWIVTPMASFSIFFLLYLLLPTRRVGVLAVVPGAVLAAVMLKLASWVYLLFLETLVTLNPLYISIGSLAGLMLWLYVSSFVFMVGAEAVSVWDHEFFPHLSDGDELHLSDGQSPRKRVASKSKK
jgi:membrane protein